MRKLKDLFKVFFDLFKFNFFPLEKFFIPNQIIEVKGYYFIWLSQSGLFINDILKQYPNDFSDKYLVITAIDCGIPKWIETEWPKLGMNIEYFPNVVIVLPGSLTTFVENMELVTSDTIYFCKTRPPDERLKSIKPGGVFLFKPDIQKSTTNIAEDMSFLGADFLLTQDSAESGVLVVSRDKLLLDKIVNEFSSLIKKE